jgi:DNA mismatch repair protein MutL
VRTMGFRGEAIPSIASVSRFVLTSRTAEDEVATRIVVDGGKQSPPELVGAPKGTTVEVSDLFFNVPARRKFLKSAATEMSHLTDAVVRTALSRPSVSFSLRSDGRSILEAPAHVEADPRGRLARILGRPIADRLHPILEQEGSRVRVHGFAGAPELSERTTRGLYTFVNGRFVKERTIQHALQDAYRTVMERGRYPTVLLFVELDPSALDVNVHPQKTEVRFVSSGDVHRAVTNALGRTLQAQPWINKAAAPPVRSYTMAPIGPLDSQPASDRGSYSPSSGRSPYASDGPARGRYVPDLGPGWSSKETAPLFPPRPSFAPTSPSGAQNEAPLLGPFSSLEPVGQVLGTYLVCRAADKMVLIDQHAAHERIAFEKLKAEQRGRGVAIQPLLVPLSLELDPARSAIVQAEKERLLACGFELEPFGGETWLLKTAPAALGTSDLSALVLDVIDDLKEVGESSSIEERIERMLSCAACHTVVRAGDRLDNLEIGALLRQMDQIDFGAHCPHGRPVFVEWSAAELGRLFHRT